MSRCLREETLWLVFEGGGSARQKAHVKGCERCAARLRRLTDDLHVLSHVLRAAPPTTAGARSWGVFLWRWVPVTAAGAAVVALFWSGVLTPEAPPRRMAAVATMRDAEVVKILENEVYTALFTNDDLKVVAFPMRVSTLAYVQAALDGEWPCEPAKPFQRATCEQRPFFLTTEDQ